jgi:hypothetical protein
MENLKEIRNEMLSLHKTLMDIEKENYEVVNGKTTPHQLLQLLLNDEKFTWLRTISTLIVEIDEMFADKKGVNKELQNELYLQVKSLFDLDNSEDFKEFKEKYQANLDTETKVAEHHKKILKLLNTN